MEGSKVAAVVVMVQSALQVLLASLVWSEWVTNANLYLVVNYISVGPQARTVICTKYQKHSLQ